MLPANKHKQVILRTITTDLYFVFQWRKNTRMPSCSLEGAQSWLARLSYLSHLSYHILSILPILSILSYLSIYPSIFLVKFQDSIVHDVMWLSSIVFTLAIVTWPKGPAAIQHTWIVCTLVCTPTSIKTNCFLAPSLRLLRLFNTLGIKSIVLPKS